MNIADLERSLIEEAAAERRIYERGRAAGKQEAADQLTEAAAFLDRMADRFLGLSASDDAVDAAADCRAMAKRLRGEPVAVQPEHPARKQDDA